MSKLEPQSPSFPFKEDMYKFYAKRRRQPRWARVLVAVLIVSFIYLVVINTGNPARWGSEDVVKPRTAPRSRIAEELGLDTHSRAKTNQVPLNDEPRRPIKETSKDAEEEEETEQEERSRTKASKPKDKEIEVKDEVSKKLESDLKHVFAIMPDELHLRELLRPIENSGKERLRELGLRARAFRTFLEAWEEIHFVHGKTTITIRDDIVNYLSKVKDLSAISHSKGRAEIIRSYEGFRYFLTKMSDLLFPFTAPYFADHMSLHASMRYGGRGIVLSGGDGQLSYMLTSVKALRKLGCNLPVEIMYLGDDDLGDDSRSELEALPGVITRDMEQMVRDEGWQLKGWAGKPFAILLSSFREAIFIDADAQFFVTPEVLFEDEAYEENGALFFRDRLMFPESKRKWLQQILPKPMSRKVRHSRFWTGESGHMQESGVVVVDKWRHFMALLFVTRMNGPDRDGDKDKGIVGTYDMVYGDKETFWLGWELVGDSDYAFHPGNAGNMGVAYEDIKDALKRITTSDDSEETPVEDEAEKTKADKPEKSLDDTKPAESVKDQKEAEVAKEKAGLEGKPATEGAGKDEAADPAAAPAAEGPLGDKPAAAVEDKPKARVKRATVPRRDNSDGEMNALGGSLNNDADLSISTEPTKNYTVCAPQLLHLDRKGRPLWFNGWIMDNKFDADHAKLSKFEVYMSEMKHGATEADWRLEQNNMCCLISDKIHKFTKQERLILKNIVKMAEDSGALGKHRG
ncbi:hypothetical protein KVT40_008213 [Elsinoe batatas]|uniref:Alpha-1,3-mannosyltransferase n=1 Tax=Elsinoe batatas TaxID=2601811 RepID=A0A8K0PC68_9PEZI|nr:hypothetical protein KVT40_008213 [Elsinoe batatas]